jgi:hypothetical protein
VSPATGSQEGNRSASGSGTRARCALGLRIEPHRLHWAIVSGSADAPVLEAHDHAIAPVAYSEARKLAWYRDRVSHIIQQFTPVIAAVRYAEVFGRTRVRESDSVRARIEGVVMEAAISHGLRVLTGALNTIASKLETNTAKKYLEQDDLRGLDWRGLPTNRKEAILVAAAALGSLESEEPREGKSDG